MKKDKNVLKNRVIATLLDFLIILVIGSLLYFLLSTLKVGIIAIVAAIVSVCAVYPVLFELTPMHGTPGMRMMKIHMDFGRTKHPCIVVIKRALWRWILCFPFGLGYWYAFFESNGQTMYDYVSKVKIVSIKNRSKHHETPCVYRKHGDGTYEACIMDKDILMFGRNPGACNVLFDIDESGVSRCHCRIIYNKQTDMFLLEDLGSSYGTYLGNGTRISPGKAVVLLCDDKFYVGKIENEFVVGFADC